MRWLLYIYCGIYTYVLTIQNKLRTQSWTKGARSSKSGRGQLFTYLLGAQIRHLQSVRHDPNAKVTPVFGLYIDELKVWDILVMQWKLGWPIIVNVACAAFCA